MTPDLLAQLEASLGETYAFERELGGGGMSRVFLARERALGRKVVVKVLLPELGLGVSMDRFRREIHLAAQLQHPHIVPLLAAGDAGGLPYFTMPFVAGESLRARLARDRELPVPDAVRILRDVASALNYAHGMGVVHRDIKPDNVLLPVGVAVVTDFGVAKALTVSAEHAAVAPGVTHITSLGFALGTPTYMAPEQASADPAMDHRVDIYALGVMGYELLTGEPPFSGRSPQAILGAHVAVVPTPVTDRRPGLPPALAALVMRCLEKRPADRPQAAAEVMHTLDMMTTPSGGTHPVAAVPVAQRRGRRPRTAMILPALGTLVIAAAALFLGRRELGWGEPDNAVDTVASTAAPAPAPPAPTPTPTPSDSAPAEPPPRSEVPSREVETPSREARPEVTPDRRDEPLRADTTPAAVPPPTAESIRGVVPAVDSPVPAPAAVSPTRPRERQQPEARPVAREPAPQPVDPRPAINALVADYAAAIESRNVANVQRIYPGLTAGQRRGWEQFFETVDAVDVELAISELRISGDRAEARLTGEMVYENSSTRRTERQPVNFHAVLRREADRWRIGTID